MLIKLSFLFLKKKTIKETVETKWNGIDFFKNVFLILTVPAEYSEGTKAIMRACAYDAELIDEKFSKKLQFTTERKYLFIIIYFIIIHNIHNVFLFLLIQLKQ